MDPLRANRFFSTLATVILFPFVVLGILTLGAFVAAVIVFVAYPAAILCGIYLIGKLAWQAITSSGGSAKPVAGTHAAGRPASHAPSDASDAKQRKSPLWIQ